MPPDKRGARPAASRRTPQKIIAVDNSDGSKHSPDHPPPQGLIPIAAEIVANLKFRRQVERLHRLGPRSMAELLAEIGAERSITTIIDQKLDRYAELDPEALAAASADDFWPAPLHEVPR